MKFLRDEKGQGLSEYALIIALVAVVAIAGLVLLGPIILDKFNEISCGMQGAGWGNKFDATNATTHGIKGEGWYYFSGPQAAGSVTISNVAYKWSAVTAAGCAKVTK